jgi:hypothetical protein
MELELRRLSSLKLRIEGGLDFSEVLAGALHALEGRGRVLSNLSRAVSVKN